MPETNKSPDWNQVRSQGESWVLKVRNWRQHPREAGITAGGLVLLLFLTGTIFTHGRTERIPSVKAKRGALTIKVSETGGLRAQEQVTISAPNDKQILWLAPEGAAVEEGDTLVVFESEKYVISKGEAQASFEVERANLTKAQNDLEAQRSREEAARKRYESLPALAKKGYVQESEVEQARLDYMELKSRSRSMEAGVRAAEANVTRASSAVAQEVRRLKQGVIFAPRAGLVVYAAAGSEEEAKKVTVGMTPFQGMDLMYLPDISRMLVDTQISEVDLAKVRPGLAATIQLDAFPGVQFKGDVLAVGNLARRRINRATGKATGARVFDVTVRVLAKDYRLKPGLTASVDIMANQYADALFVPMEAVFFDEEEHPIIYVKHGGRIEARRVDLGESNDRFTIVNKNLKEGEEVLLGQPGPA